MSLSSENNKSIFVCNNSTVNFDFDFKVFDEADLEVILYTIADGTETVLTLSTDYSTSLLTETGGRVTTVATYSSAYKLIVRRNQPIIQELDYTQNDPLSTPNLEEQLDKITMMIQDLQEQLDRAVKFDSSIIDADTVVDLPDVTATVQGIDIGALPEKTAPVDDDVFIIEDSEDDNKQKKVKKTKVLVINTLAEKTTIADNDLFLIEDSAQSNIRKKVKKSNLVPLDTDGTLADNSDTQIPSQKAVKTYADTKISKTTAGEINAMTEKTSLASDDLILIEDSANSYAKRKVKRSKFTFSSKSALYFEPDGTAIIQFDNGSKGTDIAGNTLTVAGATDADLAAGKISHLCYNLDGANDYVLVAHNANQAGMTALTIEALVYLDTANATNAILYNVTNGYITLYFTATNIKGRIVTASGTEEWDKAHSLASNGVGQWLYVVITWDSSSDSVVYLNGVSLGAGGGAGDGAVNDSAAGVNIGADESNTGKWDGKIDGVRVLRRKMSATEVLARYNELIA